MSNNFRAKLRKAKNQGINSLKKFFNLPSPPQLYGPLGLAKNWLDYTGYSQSDITWQQVYPTIKCHWNPQKTTNWGRYNYDFTKNLKPEIPPTGVLTIPQGQVMDIQGYTFTKDDQFLADVSYWRNRLGYANLPKEKYPHEKINGTCLSLITNASNNYSHFLLDSLPRLHLFYQAGYTLDDVDYILLHQPMSANAWSIFRQLGIDESKCRWAKKNTTFQADTLIATTHPSLNLHHPRWLVDFLTKQIDLKPCQPQRRLYIPRPTGRRKVANEDELLPILTKYGFEIFKPEEEVNQPQVFHEASIIVASHGAALSNLAFCQPGTKVLELMSNGHLREYFFTLSQVAGLEHHYIIGKTTQPISYVGGLCFHDFIINPHFLRKALQFLTI